MFFCCYHILCQHVKPTWQVVCKSVCQRWHLLLLAQPPPSLNYTTTLAKKGHLEVLQWAVSQGCPWDKDTCAKAALYDHLKVLKWARGQGCCWDERTCARATKGGLLEVLQWLRSQGCPLECVEMCLCCLWRPFRGVAMGQKPRLSLE